MSDQLRESLSALMDDEAQVLELRRLLAVDDADKTAIEQSWSRYHLAREVMHEPGANTQFRHLDISQQVSMAIREQPASIINKVDKPWWQPVAGFAVAVSVAAAVVIGVQSTGSVTPGFDNGLPASERSVIAGRVYPVNIQNQGGGSLQASGNVTTYRNTVLPNAVILNVPLEGADLEAQQRLEMLMLRDAERAALDVGQGVVPVSDYGVSADDAK